MTRTRYLLKQVTRGIKNPKEVLWKCNRLYHRRFRGRSGIDVMAQDWDNLLILDACRYDMFSELNPFDGELSSVVSKGSTTVEFLRNNFQDETYPATIYISANPHVQNHGVDEKFFDRARLWETNWDNELRTVPPSEVVDVSIDMHHRHPFKKLIVHFIQPHYPFIGETGRRIEHGTVTGDGLIFEERDSTDIWTKLERGEIEKETVWEAYVENLALTFPHVQNLIDELDGKTVVTSDHGNALGEWGVYGHPGGRYMSELVRVPWLVLDSAPRRTIRAGSIREVSQDSIADSRLRDLGYA